MEFIAVYIDNDRYAVATFSAADMPNDYPGKIEALIAAHQLAASDGIPVFDLTNVSREELQCHGFCR